MRTLNPSVDNVEARLKYSVMLVMGPGALLSMPTPDSGDGLAAQPTDHHHRHGCAGTLPMSARPASTVVDVMDRGAPRGKAR